jgi:hypothetical protein
MPRPAKVSGGAVPSSCHDERACVEAAASPGALSSRSVRALSLTRFGQVLGIAACLVAMTLYLVMAWFNPYVEGATRPPMMVPHLMIGLHAAGLAAAALRAVFSMYVTFLLVFLPVGFYLLSSPGMFRWIGVADLVFLGAAGCVHAGRRLLRASPSSSRG